MIKLSQKIESVLQELEQLGDEFAVESQPEWSSTAAKKGSKTVKLWQVPRTTGEFLHVMAAQMKPRTIIELGTSAGYSALWMGSAAAEYGGKVYTIDSSSMKVDMARTYIERAGLSDSIEVVHAPIADALERSPEEWEWDTPIDMVFLDADKKNYLRFFKMLEPHLSSTAFIFADDAIKIAHAMEDFIAYVKESPEYLVTLIEQDHGLLIAQRLQNPDQIQEG